MQRLIAVIYAGAIRHKQKKGVPQIVLYLLHHQGDIAQAPGIVGDRGGIGHIQGFGRRAQMGGRTDTANPWCNHQTVQGCAPGHQIFDPAVHGSHTARLAHHIILIDFDLQFQVAFHPVHRYDSGDVTLHIPVFLLSSRLGAAAAAMPL